MAVMNWTLRMGAMRFIAMPHISPMPVYGPNDVQPDHAYPAKSPDSIIPISPPERMS
jgi:hypothetical protein